MFILYDLIFLLVALIYLPVYLFKRKMHRGLILRLGFLPGDLKLDRPIWVHAVSVGEVMAVKGLIARLKREFPDKRLVISTVTATGNKIARALAAEDDFVTYLPFDFSFIVKSVIDKINPHIFIIAETEIWPNLTTCLYKKNVPLITVNGRLSDSSFRGYLSVRFLLKNILRKFSLFCVQTERDAERLMQLGVEPDKIQITGNIKFDTMPQNVKEGQGADYKARLCLKPEDKLLVAGSTHYPEERIILEVYKDLIRGLPNLKLLIAPRHPERAKSVSAQISQLGFRSVPVSGSAYQCTNCISNEVFILDTVGELSSFYALADIVFVGGSLAKNGGHNILEPASMSKPVLFGPHMFNFRDIAELFLSKKAAIMVHNEEELKAAVLSLLRSPQLGIELGRLSRKIILENQGATNRTLGFIKAVVPG